MNIVDLPHGELGIITMTVARLIWTRDRVTGLALAFFAAIHFTIAIAYVFGWRG